MNATQTQTGGERKSMGRWIDRWIDNRAKPARGRVRTSTALSVEGLEGRVVLSGASAIGTTVLQNVATEIGDTLTISNTALQNLASTIVQYSEHLVLQQPQKLATVISAYESPQNLNAMINTLPHNVLVTAPTSIYASSVSIYGAEYTNFAEQVSVESEYVLVDGDVSIDLRTQPTSIPSADVNSALLTSLNNAITAAQTAVKYDVQAQQVNSQLEAQFNAQFNAQRQFNDATGANKPGPFMAAAGKLPSLPTTLAQAGLPSFPTTVASTLLTGNPTVYQSSANSAPTVTFGGVNEGWAVSASPATLQNALGTVQSYLDGLPGNADPSTGGFEA